MAAPESTSDMPAPIRDPKYYLEGRYIIFNVEGYLFRVPSRKLAEHSTGFRDMLQLPTPTADAVEGDTDESPVIIPEEKAAVFRHAMQWTLENQTLANITQDEWEALFRFANKWGFDQLEQQCLNKLEEFDWDPWKQLAFCSEFSLPYTWAHKAFTKLCQRKPSHESTLEIFEAVKVGGWPLFAILAHVRQLHLQANAQIGWQYRVQYVEWKPEYPTVEQLTTWIPEAEQAAKAAVYSQ
ncbi:hypothetical protein BDP27DRAFT_1420118 [Rhodocollybia butyracea]|uniref:BTB domain-containing protein n=1 Tax=Rhodocollybia butyracea TaxID=206335 RepID=A0A9P5U8S6_9AGAR|nr:hypothetical protein BDP27DRAFT_1420118 [Rhodocollybia butyracea]